MVACLRPAWKERHGERPNAQGRRTVRLGGRRSSLQRSRERGSGDLRGAFPAPGLRNHVIERHFARGSEASLCAQHAGLFVLALALNAPPNAAGVTGSTACRETGCMTSGTQGTAIATVVATHLTTTDCSLRPPIIGDARNDPRGRTRRRGERIEVRTELTSSKLRGIQRKLEVKMGITGDGESFLPAPPGQPCHPGRGGGIGKTAWRGPHGGIPDERRAACDVAY